MIDSGDLDGAPCFLGHLGILLFFEPLLLGGKCPMKLPLSLGMSVGQLTHGLQTAIRTFMKFAELLKGQNTFKIRFICVPKI